MPKEINNLINIKDIYINSYDLKKLPKGIGKLINLKKFNIVCHRLIELPKEIFNLINLEKLHYIGNRYLIELPKEIGNLTNLKELTIISEEGKKLKLPKEIGNLINLKNLNIICDNLIELSKEIGSLINLESLDIYSPKLKELPNETNNLISLKKLNINCKYLNKLPNEIGNLTNLKELFINCNILENFPDGIERLTNLEKLIIFGKSCNLKILPMEEIKKLKKLNNIKKFEMRLNEIFITDENEKEYWIGYKKTLSPKIKEAFVVKYNNLVEYASNRIYLKNKYRRDIKLKDLARYGSFGLLNAIDEYEPDIDIKFKNYALIGIMASIYEEIRKIKTSPPKDIQNLINIILNQNKEEE